MIKTLKDFFDELNERNVEITKPSPTDKWGLKITTQDGKQSQTYQELDPTWQAAVKEVVGWIRKNLNYADFQADMEPVDLQFKADGSVIIKSDTGSIDFEGKKVPFVKYKLSSGIASKIASSMGG